MLTDEQLRKPAMEAAFTTVPTQTWLFGPVSYSSYRLASRPSVNPAQLLEHDKANALASAQDVSRADQLTCKPCNAFMPSQRDVAHQRSASWPSDGFQRESRPTRGASSRSQDPGLETISKVIEALLSFQNGMRLTMGH